MQTVLVERGTKMGCLQITADAKTHNALRPHA